MGTDSQREDDAWSRMSELWQTDVLHQKRIRPLYAMRLRHEAACRYARKREALPVLWGVESVQRHLPRVRGFLQLSPGRPIGAVRKGKPFPITMDQAVEVMKVADAARKGKWGK